MGGIWLEAGVLHGEASEQIGYKSGLALTYGQVFEHLEGRPGLKRLWEMNVASVIRIRSGEYEDLLAHLLYAVGNTRSPSNIPPVMTLHRQFAGDPELQDLAMKVAGFWTEHMRGFIDQNPPFGTLWDPTQFFETSRQRWGLTGAAMALKLVELIAEQQHRSPWGPFRRFEWSNVEELSALFETESLDAAHGQFLDQRFVDYLAQNPSSLDSMHWRKFEGLTAAFFARFGYHVEPGPGRNDDGIDVRVWPDKAAAGGPPTIIVQCKRQKAKVPKVVVKALWADVVHDRAKLGLVVTTSSLSPGARAVCTGRSYPVVAAERDTVKAWVSAMRTPGNGVFLAR